MNQMQNRVVGIFLLLCFAFALFPAELFHQHEWESEICKQSELHFANHSIDCELADFYIAKHLKNEVEPISSFSIILSEYLQVEETRLYFKQMVCLKVRGPPELS